MKVLVTGHHGYVGAVAAPALAQAGHEVVGLDTFYYDGCDFLPDEVGVEAIRRDVRDVEPGDLAGFEAVVHLAALSNDPLGDMDADWTYDVNLRATLGLAEAARTAGVERFVFASSCSMYGASDSGAPVGEDAELRPLTAYAESKVRSEAGLSALAGEGFSPAYLRFATAYGVSPRLRVDIVLNNLVAWAHTTGKVRIMSDGTPWRPLIHVRDMAAAIRAALEAPREVVHDEAFNVGRGDENHQVRDLGEFVRETVPGCEVEYGPESGPDPRSYRVDFTKFERAFPGCRLEWSARQGAKELYEAYRGAGFTLEDFESERYTRLKRLRGLVESGALDATLRWARDPVGGGTR